MDGHLYLVNSGKCDFCNPIPSLRNALYRDGALISVNNTTPLHVREEAKRHWHDCEASLHLSRGMPFTA